MKSVQKWLPGYLVIIISVLTIAIWYSEAITVLAENSSPIRSKIVIIDPGHGGVDGGAISCTGLPESKYNLEISLRLNDLLNLLGHKTRLIRNEDISVYTDGNTISQKKISDLKERARIVNSYEDALLLSIHQNNFPDSRYSGAQVFFAKTDRSQNVAEDLQQAFIRYLNPDSHRHEKKSSGIYLLEHIQCPAVLIECGFLSNPEEEAKLRNRNYQQKLCSIIACIAGSHNSNT